ncbi:hypothetical protein LV469_07735 [Peptoniphilus sp. GNH]|nr:hypothetical protein LV469_07735 [Peptoniphilus sp. GNH]
MNKRILSLVLALVMVLGTFGSVFAAEAKAEVKEKTKEVPKLTSSDAKIQWLQDVKIVEGRKVNEDEKNNDLALDKTIQRAEVTKLLVYAIGKQDLAEQLKGAVRPFKDVEAGYWANGFITVGSTSPSPANGLPFLNGYPSGKFEGKWNVSYAELAKMLVVLAKKDLTKDLLVKANADWPSQWMRYAAEMGILEGVTVANSNDNATRKDAFTMIYNAMFAMKEWRLYPSNETIGVISKATNDKITLGGIEKDVEFKVNEKTNFVPAEAKDATTPYHPIGWMTYVTYGSGYYIGSLVRVLADKDGNVTHIIQLGNPEHLDLKTQGWAPIADDHDNGTVDLRKANLTFKEAKLAKIDTDSHTRYFVADVNKGRVKEVKSMSDIRSYFKYETEFANRVYLGFEKVEVSGRRIARLVVFNQVDKTNLRGDLVRISNPVISNYSVLAQEAGEKATEAKEYKLGDYKYYPYAYKADKYDIVNLNGYNGTIETEIDYDKTPTFKVEKIYTRGQNGLPFVNGYTTAIKLSDGRGEQVYGVARDIDTWFANEIREGAYVQVKFGEANKEITLISVVPKNNVPGDLPNGMVKDAKTVKVLSVEKFNGVSLVTYLDGAYRNTVAVTDNDVLNVALNDEIRIEPVFRYVQVQNYYGKVESFAVYRIAQNITKDTNDATTAVTTFEGAVNEANLNAAKAKVAALPEGTTKAALEKRIEVKLVAEAKTTIGNPVQITAPAAFTAEELVKAANAKLNATVNKHFADVKVSASELTAIPGEADKYTANITLTYGNESVVVPVKVER